MKKMKLLVLILVLLIFTGCADVDVNMEIKANKKVSLVITEMVDKNYLKNDLPYISSKDLKKYEDNGVLIKNYIVDDKIGHQMVKNYTNIDKISTEEVKKVDNVIEEMVSENPELFTVEKGLFRNKYVANYKVSGFKNEIGSNNSNIVFSLKLPYNSITNNATEVNNDKTLSWDINKMSDEYITFEFYMYNWTPIIIVGILSIGMISYFISSTHYYKRKNYKKVALVNTKNI